MSAPRLLLIDNYDSFTWNLYQLFCVAGATVTVVRNDAAKVDDLLVQGFSHVVVGPGPRGPDKSGISLEVIDRFKGSTPILGICLGMQAFALLFGGRVERTAPVHGKTDLIFHRNSGIHTGIPSPFEATRYHSLTVRGIDPEKLEVTAENKEGLIMGLRHRHFPTLEGIQYHPESFMTPFGDRIALNFLEKHDA